MRTITILVIVLTASCAGDAPPDGGASEEASAPEAPTAGVVQDIADRVVVIDGMAGPEAVRYDPEQDVYFVSNWSADEPNDGFVSRVGAADGVVETLRFAVGTEEVPLDDPRGMYLVGDTLWVADVAGVHGFDRTTGAHLAFHDFSAFEPGFLNDLAVGPDGRIHVTDTGAGRIYRIGEEGPGVVAEDEALGPPNGIAWDAVGERFLLAPWGGVQTLRAWSPADGEVTEVAVSGGAFFDGIEVVGERVVVASQADSSLHVVRLRRVDAEELPTTSILVRVPGEPADIAVDDRRGRVAVPYIALDRVDVWRLPAG